MKTIAMYNSPLFRLKSTLVQAKRRLFNWRGDGVHSPYAYRVIRDTIRNPHPFSTFRSLYNAEQAQALQHKYQDRYYTKKQHLELLFRFVHNHKPQTIYFGETNESLIPSYLQATGYYKTSVSIEQAEMIIIEDTCPSAEEIITRAKTGANLYILLNTHNPKVRAWANEYRKQICPPIVFDTLALQAWVWRAATTPGYYPVYY